MGNVYVCAKCLEQFVSDVSDAEARSAHDRQFPEVAHVPKQQLEVLCEGCYADFMIWFEQLTPEERAEMEEASRER